MPCRAKVVSPLSESGDACARQAGAATAYGEIANAYSSNLYVEILLGATPSKPTKMEEEKTTKELMKEMGHRGSGLFKCKKCGEIHCQEVFEINGELKFIPEHKCACDENG